MREIKFRAVGEFGEEKVISEPFTLSQILFEYGFEYVFNDGSSLPLKDCGEGDLKYIQYTGLKDKNGKDRYEGNIFKSEVCLSPDGISSAHNIYYWIPVVCEIVFLNGSFVGKWEIKNHSEGKYSFTDKSGYKELTSFQEDIGNIREEKLCN